MLTYDELKVKSDKINEKFPEWGFGSEVPFNADSLKNNDKILIMGINPGEKKSGDFFFYYVQDDEVKKVLKKNMHYEKYFKRLYELFEDVRSPWENSVYFDKWTERTGLNEKYPKIFNSITEHNKKIEQNGNERYLIFADFVYVKKGNQNEVIAELKKNETQREVLELFKNQLEYYRPKLTLINNACVSDIIRDSFMNGTSLIIDKEKTHGAYTLVNGEKSTIIFSGYIPQGRMDNYSVERLKREIKDIMKN